MALYPSLEDMKVDQMVTEQIKQVSNYFATAPPSYSTMATAPQNFNSPASLYPTLNDYMGLELSQEVIALNMPEYLNNREIAKRDVGNTSMIAPISGQSKALKSHVTNGIREVTLCKDGGGKVGLRVRDIDNGIFVCLVKAGSPAALAGLRFGDQILQIENEAVAGYSMDKVHGIFKRCPLNEISVVVRDRPFERTVTLHKDSHNLVGFQFKNGKITTIVKDSSAARNGLLTDHQILEINGQNVIGLKDKEIIKIIQDGGDVISVTIIPSFIYDHMIKKMNINLIKESMDHSSSF